jgi:integrase/recombinase XerD
MEILNSLENFRKELERKGYRRNSIDNYISYCSVFLNRYKDRKCPKYVSEQDIKDFLRGFKEHNTQRAYHSAIKAFYKYVVKQPNKFKYIEYVKKNRKLPIVLSAEEMKAIIDVATNVKHKTIIMLMYSCGLRVGEVINLKISDIDSGRGVIYIRNAKGGKDRQVALHEKLLTQLREYYKQYRPKEYLFNGQFAPQYTETSIRAFLSDYACAASVSKRVYPHLIRHSSFTNMLEAGVDISIISKIAGHGRVETTRLYTHISSSLINRVYNPLQAI